MKVVKNWKNDLKQVSINISVKYCFQGGTITHKHRAGSNWADSRAAEKGARTITGYRARMTQEHNAFF